MVTIKSCAPSITNLHSNVMQLCQEVEIHGFAAPVYSMRVVFFVFFSEVNGTTGQPFDLAATQLYRCPSLVFVSAAESCLAER